MHYARGGCDCQNAAVGGRGANLHSLGKSDHAGVRRLRGRGGRVASRSAGSGGCAHGGCVGKAHKSAGRGPRHCGAWIRQHLVRAVRRNDVGVPNGALERTRAARPRRQGAVSRDAASRNGNLCIQGVMDCTECGRSPQRHSQSVRHRGVRTSWPGSYRSAVRRHRRQDRRIA